jgi:hypothetical protein
VRNTKTVKTNVVIFASSNSTERLSKPLLSRFTVFEIPEYSYPEFEAIAVRIIKKLPQNAVIQIASSVWLTGSSDIRDVLKIAKLCNPADGEEDITRLITISQKYHKTGNEYNIEQCVLIFIFNKWVILTAVCIIHQYQSSSAQSLSTKYPISTG